MREGPIDEVGAIALAEVTAMKTIVEILAPMTRAQRLAVLAAAKAQVDADAARAHAESLLREPAAPSAPILGCEHGRLPGQPCPHCMGINAPSPTAPTTCTTCGGTRAVYSSVSADGRCPDCRRAT